MTVQMDAFLFDDESTLSRIEVPNGSQNSASYDFVNDAEEHERCIQRLVGDNIDNGFWVTAT